MLTLDYPKSSKIWC